MSVEISEGTIQRFAMYQDIEISEQQIKKGQVRDAGTALAEMRTKYKAEIEREESKL
ncbi:MAG: hypothetical protein K2O34_14010 [Acetatifactor sp.]|nr:hypothetical protein [Acetatifactor sp.]